MNGKRKTALGWAVLAILLAPAVVSCKPRGQASVNLTLRLLVTPREQIPFVITQASGARFRYEVAKKAGLTPGLVQKFSLRPVAESSFVEFQLRVQTKEEAGRFAEALVEMLRGQCGPQADVTVAKQSIR